MSTQAAAEEFELGDSPDKIAPSLNEAPSKVSADQSINFRLMALYQIILRTGWIFKTESIIMPAVLDTIGGPGWLRGCLPMLNRFGQSIPPVLASARIHAMTRKKLVLASSTSVMGLTFLALALLWTVGTGESSAAAAWWMPYAFLLLYGIFFISTGINQLTFSTLTGKLIPVQRRGRLMLFASTIGTATAVLCAALLLPAWLTAASGNFFAIFAFTGTLFIAGGLVVLFLDEQRDSFPSTKYRVSTLFRAAGQALTEDVNLRRLAIVSALFGMSLTLFPHYQALGRQRLSLGLDALIPWVITQNIGVAVFSVPAGWLADRRGNRLVLQLLLGIVCSVPLIALGIARWGEPSGASFTTVFFLIGATPVTIRTLSNYCLELAGRELQPRYLSTLSLCTAGPAILTAPLVGWLVDLVGFEWMFLAVEGCMVAAWLMTFVLVEPRVPATSAPE